MVHIGKEGLSEGALTAVNTQLAHHELIKVRLAESVEIDRHTIASDLAGATGADVAQVLGRTILLYKQRPEDPRIQLPAAPSTEVPGDPLSDDVTPE